MRAEREGERHRIRLDDEENPRDVLRAFAVASFERARPVAMSRLHFEGGSTLTPEDADNFIELRDGKLTLRMDYVEGRQVKTFADQDDDGSVIIDTWLFERDRGELEPVLERTAEILTGGGAMSLPVEAVSTKGMYEGKSLEFRLKELGYNRETNECDSDLKKRVFPDLYRKEPIFAAEILFGQRAVEWDNAKRIIVLELLQVERSDEYLEDFAFLAEQLGLM